MVMRMLGLSTQLFFTGKWMASMMIEGDNGCGPITMHA